MAVARMSFGSPTTNGPIRARARAPSRKRAETVPIGLCRAKRSSDVRRRRVARSASIGIAPSASAAPGAPPPAAPTPFRTLALSRATIVPLSKNSILDARVQVGVEDVGEQVGEDEH